ncbi:SigE family RNA polymerase sigma factor [Actinospica sp. MGRD01-02]|uniref:SigE family RNA polymerase sigma factor n=1 Tax=Actinospica acidithermotolerans TaxID=2828514 RepID=A0A941IH10_9ACTN|nr:SigE family RNA polymerase sigma factor [Actinospica acidithermotolerans]MBR7826709.1 SigE family RNA polymerase sigma factor [Actinospica acidithermotolerans]
MRRALDEVAAGEFRDFVIGSQTRLIKFAELLTRDLGHAEDLVQHAYAKVFASWPKLRGGHPEAYARRCIVNGHRDRWRRGIWKESPVEESADYADRATRESVSEENAERDAVLRALGGLTQRERAAVALKYFYDLSTEEIALELGVAAATVRTTVFRALAKLREDQHLAREGKRS